VVAVGENHPLAAGYLIDPPRQSDGEPGHSARKRDLVISFDDQVNVVGLYREMNHLKPFPPCLVECPTNRKKHKLLSKARQAPSASHRHVHRVILGMRGARAMRDRSTRASFCFLAGFPAPAVHSER
jgi:hypothetical protein